MRGRGTRRSGLLLSPGLGTEGARGGPPSGGSHLRHRHFRFAKNCAAVGLDDLLVKTIRIFGNTAQRPVVDVYQAESLLVAVGPLEIVQRRPMMVAAYGNSVA